MDDLSGEEASRMSSRTDQPVRIVSAFANDPTMRDLVDLYLSELPNRIGELSRAIEDEDMAALRTLSHQMKGSAPGYGFPTVGDAAAAVERELHELDEAGSMSETIAAHVRRLIDQCERCLGDKAA